MPKIAVHNSKGEQVGEMELSPAIFAAPVNEAAVHEVVVAYLANQRRGTASTKTRGMVRGGGRKPWRQKGTGRARHGSIRSPIWTGGGTVFGPHPRDYSVRLPKKLKRVALRSALTTKYNNNEIIVLDQLSMETPRTKDVVQLLKNLKVEGKAVLITADPSPAVYKSARNIPGVSTGIADNINTYQVLNSGSLILTRDAVARIEEVFA
ncbi:MAG TPA: 50S ribosomal protein L4 [Bacillota bacterium]|nr:50S ribosomal protein L4 [Bacillota bacterium]HQE01949.1 50S ribosomal protein L4 [Bacillota bacterium]